MDGLNGSPVPSGQADPEGGPVGSNPSMMAGVDVDVAIIGAGFAGLAMAHRLRQRGIRDLVIVERGDDVGGTWRDNTYPGAACDVPSHLYSLSFAPNPGWTRTYSGQPEIQAYLQGVAERFGLARHLRLGCRLLKADWDEPTTRWLLETSSGPISARYLVSGAGALADPRLPEVDGIDRFGGHLFHSARWDHDVDLAGKRVAVVGTGASAIQIVPAIQSNVDHLVLLQRTPPWIIPRTDRPISGMERAVYRKLPLAQRAVRAGVYLSRELMVPSFHHRRLSALPRTLAMAHLRRQVPDKALRDRLTPDYRIGCKRILISNDYYPALTKPNVTVAGPLDSVTTDGVVDADGAEHSVDVIVFATGFDVQGLPIAHRVFGRRNGGDEPAPSLFERFRQGPTAHQGTMFNGFPNFFMLLGPNTGLGHTSQVVMIEAQVNLVADLLAQARSQGVGRIEVPVGDQRQWAERIDHEMEGTVWTSGGCRSWYLDEDGRNTTLWPASTLRFRRLLRGPRLDRYTADPGRRPSVDRTKGAHLVDA